MPVAARRHPYPFCWPLHSHRSRTMCFQRLLAGCCGPPTTRNPTRPCPDVHVPTSLPGSPPSSVVETAHLSDEASASEHHGASGAAQSLRSPVRLQAPHSAIATVCSRRHAWLTHLRAFCRLCPRIYAHVRTHVTQVFDLRGMSDARRFQVYRRSDLHSRVLHRSVLPLYAVFLVRA